ncbi:hypothetical protein KJ761_00280 [Patescibacteria group bacterium]|nr:hypothetical protein [Patescibacteria group bacterium]
MPRITCKKSVVMENGNHAGKEVFIAGKKYKTRLLMSSEFITLIVTDKFGGGNHVLKTRVHPADSAFLHEHFGNNLLIE